MNIDIVNIAGMISTDWKAVIRDLAYKHKDIINTKLNNEEIVPPSDLIFNAFNMFDQKDLKVCIIGMDPYINVGEAMGLAFSVPENTRCPPSLRNIFKELSNEYCVVRTNTDLSDWSKQGVLLLNTALTTLQNKSGCHVNIWKDFTRNVVEYITGNFKNIVYILWGAHAKQFESLIDTSCNLVLKHSHPSPLSRKQFVGNGHFRLCNEYLSEHGRVEIDWVG
jgi:uracil-DNA glycosylase